MIRFLVLCSILHVGHALNAQANRTDVEKFAHKYATKHHVPVQDIIEVLSKAEFQQGIIDRMDKPAEKMPWHRYRKIFIQQERIDAGIAFIKDNRTTLNSVSQSTGVPVEILAAIIGVESYFGRIKGSFRVLDALYTLSFGYPRRATFFQSELDEYITLTREEKLDIYALKGSYAGAMGYGQFMPSSYRAYAKSFDEGNRDLFNSVDDAIASVGNYLDVHRWEEGAPIATPAKKLPDAAAMPKQSLKPSNTLAYYTGKNYEPEAYWSSDTKTTLLEFELEEGNEYWFAAHNFYVITRYNHSPLYALAVFQLAEAIKDPKP